MIFQAVRAYHSFLKRSNEELGNLKKKKNKVNQKNPTPELAWFEHIWFKNRKLFFFCLPLTYCTKEQKPHMLMLHSEVHALHYFCIIHCWGYCKVHFSKQCKITLAARLATDHNRKSCSPVFSVLKKETCITKCLVFPYIKKYLSGAPIWTENFCSSRTHFSECKLFLCLTLWAFTLFRWSLRAYIFQKEIQLK